MTADATDSSFGPVRPDHSQINATEEPEWSYEEWYSDWLEQRRLFVYSNSYPFYIPITCFELLGIIGNLFSVYLFTMKMEGKTTAILFAWLSVADLMVEIYSFVFNGGLYLLTGLDIKQR